MARVASWLIKRPYRVRCCNAPNRGSVNEEAFGFERLERAIAAGGRAGRGSRPVTQRVAQRDRALADDSSLVVLRRSTQSWARTAPRGVRAKLVAKMTMSTTAQLGCAHGDVAAAVGAAPLFRRLSSEDRERLLPMAKLEQYAKGEELFREGDLPRSLLIVVRGRVKVARTTPKGRQVILQLFGPGDPLAAVAVFEGFPYPASGQAVEPTACLAIERGAFLALLERHPSLVRGLLSGLTLRLVELTNRLTELAGGRVEERLASMLLRLAQEHGQHTERGDFIPGPLSRQELADLCGTTLETTIRVMSRWAKSGWVSTRADGFVLHRVAELERLAGL